MQRPFSTPAPGAPSKPGESQNHSQHFDDNALARGGMPVHNHLFLVQGETMAEHFPRSRVAHAALDCFACFGECRLQPRLCVRRAARGLRRHRRADAQPPRCFRACWRGLACQSNRRLCDPSLSDGPKHLRLGRRAWRRRDCVDPRRAMGRKTVFRKAERSGRRLSGGLRDLRRVAVRDLALLRERPLEFYAVHCETDFGDQFRRLRGALS